MTNTSSNPLAALFHSRKFLIAIFDALASIAGYFAAKYGGPSLTDDVKVLIITLQPVFIILIAAIATEDAAEKTASQVVVQQTPAPTPGA